MGSLGIAAAAVKQTAAAGSDSGELLMFEVLLNYSNQLSSINIPQPLLQTPVMQQAVYGTDQVVSSGDVDRNAVDMGVIGLLK
jgi:hypothetical protein